MRGRPKKQTMMEAAAGAGGESVGGREGTEDAHSDFCSWFHSSY